LVELGGLLHGSEDKSLVLKLNLNQMVALFDSALVLKCHNTVADQSFLLGKDFGCFMQSAKDRHISSGAEDNFFSESTWVFNENLSLSSSSEVIESMLV
jgi:hypothetical protein